MLKRADPTAMIQPLYDAVEGKVQMVLALKMVDEFSTNILDFSEYLQLRNPWSLIPIFGKDKIGKGREQCATYTFMTVSIKYEMNHCLGLIQGYLGKRQISVKEKKMQALDTKT